MWVRLYHVFPPQSAQICFKDFASNSWIRSCKRWRRVYGKPGVVYMASPKHKYTSANILIAHWCWQCFERGRVWAAGWRWWWEMCRAVSMSSVLFQLVTDNCCLYMFGYFWVEGRHIFISHKGQSECKGSSAFSLSLFNSSRLLARFLPQNHALDTTAFRNTCSRKMERIIGLTLATD